VGCSAKRGDRGHSPRSPVQDRVGWNAGNGDNAATGGRRPVRSAPDKVTLDFDATLTSRVTDMHAAFADPTVAGTVWCGRQWEGDRASTTGVTRLTKPAGNTKGNFPWTLDVTKCPMTNSTKVHIHDDEAMQRNPEAGERTDVRFRPSLNPAAFDPMKAGVGSE